MVNLCAFNKSEDSLQNGSKDARSSFCSEVGCLVCYLVDPSVESDTKDPVCRAAKV